MSTPEYLSSLNTIQENLAAIQHLIAGIPSEKERINLQSEVNSFAERADEFIRQLDETNITHNTKEVEEQFNQLVDQYYAISQAILVQDAKSIILMSKSIPESLMPYITRNIDKMDENEVRENTSDRQKMAEFISTYVQYEAESQKAAPDPQHLIDYRNKILAKLDSLEIIEQRANSWQANNPQATMDAPQTPASEAPVVETPAVRSPQPTLPSVEKPKESNYNVNSMFGRGAELANNEIKTRMQALYKVIMEHLDHWKQFARIGLPQGVKDTKKILEGNFKSFNEIQQKKPSELRAIWDHLSAVVSERTPDKPQLQSLYQDIRNGNAKKFEERLQHLEQPQEHKMKKA